MGRAYYPIFCCDPPLFIMTAGNKNASSSASVPPAVQQFTLEELIRVLQNHRIEVISPHQQMNEGMYAGHCSICGDEALRVQ